MFRKNRRMLTAMALAVCTAFTAACSSGAGIAAPETTKEAQTQAPSETEKEAAPGAESEAAAAPEGQRHSLTMASGTNGGVFYMLAAAYSQLIPSVNPNMTINVEASAGTNENLALLSSYEADVSFANPGDALSAYEGKREFEGKAATNLRAVMSGNMNYFHVMTLEDSPIKTLEDIKGRKVSVGPTGAPYIMPEIIEAATGFVVNEDYTGEWMSHDQAAEALINGDIDAICATNAIPSSAYSSLTAAHPDVVFISLTEQEINNVTTKHPQSYVPTVIKAGAYSTIKEDTPTVGLRVLMFTNDQVDEDAIYQLTKAIMENTEAAEAIYAPAADYCLETQKESIDSYPLPIHPGAEKYYREAGLIQ